MPTLQQRATEFRSTSQGKRKGPQVDTPCHEYVEMLGRWELSNDLLGGTPTMRAAGERWLNRFPKESPKAYKNRLSVATLFNVYRQTIRFLVGRVFREPIRLSDDTDPLVREWAEDVDLQGRDLNAYAWDCLTDMLAFGKSHTMSEYPDTEELKQALSKRTLTLGDARRFALRPYWSQVSPLDLIAWDGDRVAGREMLDRVRIYEVSWLRDGEWGQKEVRQVRVVTPEWTQVYTLTQKEWQAGPEIPTTLGEVNLVTGYANRQGFMIAAPVLEDLAYLNQKHWNSQSDQDNILHVVRAAILFLAGFSDEDMKYLEIGPSVALKHQNPDAKVGYVEHTGAGINAGRQALQDLVQEMQASGAGDLMVPQPGNETATARAIGEAKTLSPLQIMALALQDYLESAFLMSGRWIKRPDLKVGVQVNTDFGAIGEVTREIELLQKDAESGRIATEDYLREAQSRGLYDSEVNIEELLERAEADRDLIPFIPPLPLPGNEATPESAPAT